MDSAEDSISIGELSARTEVAPATLRMWEERHGFPEPKRLPSGHRRYSLADIERVLSVAHERDAGMPLALAIARVLAMPSRDTQSIFAGLHRANPAIRPHLLAKRAMVALSRAVEDEYLASGERGLLVGSFQRAPFYRGVERRWAELSRLAEASFALADFRKLTVPKRGPALVPTSRELAISREWAVVCDAPRFAACLVGVEVISRDRRRDSARRFEAIWSFDPAVVRQAAELGAAIVCARAPRLAGRVRKALAHEPGPVDPRLAVAGGERMVSYLAERMAAGP